MSDAVETHVYMVDGERELELDVIAPSGPSNRTALIMLHGGGWRVGERSSLQKAGARLSELGFTAIPTEYRLLGEQAWPTPQRDVAAAVTWVAANADRIGVDAGRIVLYGHSAGGHLALLVGNAHSELTPRAAAVVAFYPPTGFYGGPVGPPLSPGSPIEYRAEGTKLGAYHVTERDTSDADARLLSPVDAVSATSPPTLLIHGGSDFMIPAAMSLRLYHTLAAAGVPCDLHLFAGQVHHFDEAPGFANLVDGLVAQFIDRTVIDPERYAREQIAHNPFAAMAADSHPDS